MKPYSRDLRERIIAALETGTDSQSEIATTSGVSLSFVEKLWRTWRKTGNCDPLPRAGGRERSLKTDEAKIRAAVAAQPDLTLAELCEQIAAANEPSVVPMMMCRSPRWIICQRNGQKVKVKGGSQPNCPGHTPALE